MTEEQLAPAADARREMNDAAVVCFSVSAAALVAAGVALLVASALGASAVGYLIWCSGLYLAMALVSLLPEPPGRQASISSPPRTERRRGMARMVAAACCTRSWTADSLAAEQR